MQGRPYVLRRFSHDRLAATFAIELAHPSVEKLCVVGDLRHGPHGGPRSAHRVFAVDGDGRRNAFNAIHLGPVHAIHELPGVRGKGLNVSPLSFSVKGVKGKRRLARPADPGDHRDLIQRDLQIQVLEIMLSGAKYTDRLVAHGLCPFEKDIEDTTDLTRGSIQHVDPAPSRRNSLQF